MQIETEKYVQIYAWAKEVITDEKLLPSRTKEQIINLISQENWLAFPKENQFTKKDIDNDPKANIFVALSGDKIIIGVTLNKKLSIDWFMEAAEEYHKADQKELLDLMHELPSDFMTELEKKKKFKHYSETPTYEEIEELTKPSNAFSEEDFDKFFKRSKELEEQGAKEKAERGVSFYPIMPTINLVTKKISFEKNAVKETVRLLYPILKVCLEIEPREIHETMKIVEKIKEWVNDKGIPQWPYGLDADDREILVKKAGLDSETIALKRAIKILRKDPICKKAVSL